MELGTRVLELAQRQHQRFDQTSGPGFTMRHSPRRREPSVQYRSTTVTGVYR